MGKKSWVYGDKLESFSSNCTKYIQLHVYILLGVILQIKATTQPMKKDIHSLFYRVWTQESGL